MQFVYDEEFDSVVYATGLRLYDDSGVKWQSKPLNITTNHTYYWSKRQEVPINQTIVGLKYPAKYNAFQFPQFSFLLGMRDSSDFTGELSFPYQMEMYPSFGQYNTHLL